DADFLAREHPEGRDVDPLAVHFHVTVADELARGLAAGGKAQAVHDVVEPGLERDEQVGALHAGLVADAIEQVAELALGEPVDPLHLLLLTQLLGVLGRLAATTLRLLAMPARPIGATLHRAL